MPRPKDIHAGNMVIKTIKGKKYIYLVRRIPGKKKLALNISLKEMATKSIESANERGEYVFTEKHSNAVKFICNLTLVN